MSPPSFNLITDKWIPCIRSDGTPVELGLRDTLSKAHELREIWDDSPLVTFALHRLLLALIYRNFPVPKLKAWAGLWEQGGFDAAVLTKYFERWSDRFNLYDEDHPFWQSTDEVLKSAPAKSVSILGHQFSAGNNAVLFDHSYDGAEMRLSHAGAARLLVAAQVFAVGGGVSSPCNFTNAPCVPGAVFLLQGNSLFQTLMLNLVVHHGVKNTGVDDVPIWERDVSACPGTEAHAPAGILEYLSWRSRRILLSPDGDACTQSRFQQGEKLSAEIWDPAKVMRKGQTDYLPLRFSTDRALWRDSHTFYADHSEKEWHAPKAVCQLAELQRNGLASGLPTRPVIEVYGIANDQAKVHSWHREQYPLPTALLMEPEKAFAVRQLTELAETAYGHLRKALWKLASDVLVPDGGRTPDKSAVSNMTDGFPAIRNFWGTLDVPFHGVIAELAEDASKAVEHWRTLLKKSARDALAQTINGLGGSPRVLKGGVEAERLLGYLLNEKF